jgi:YesN/AraC family two-component response regulator
MSKANIKTKGELLKDIAFGMRVLYVEDDLIIQEQFKSFLHRFFSHVDTANNGVEAMDFYSKAKYDLLVTDLSMPLMGGLELSKKIKEINEDQYIIVISAHSESDRLIQLINVGVEGFILKPIDVGLVMKQLIKICREISNRNMSDYYNKLLEDSNKALEKRNMEYQIALHELTEVKKTLKDKKRDSEEELELNHKIMGASEYNYIYGSELKDRDESLEELENMFNELILDPHHQDQSETLFVLHHIFRTYAYELEMLPRFRLLANSMRKLERRIKFVDQISMLPTLMQMSVSLMAELERWRIGLLKHKFMEDIHTMDNELVGEILTMEKYLAEGQ